MNRVIIGFGSNIEPEKHINEAKKIIATDFDILGESQFQRTKPVGFIDQANFLNGTILVETELNLKEFKARLSRIEDRLGRKRSPNKYDPRIIDLDIVIWNNQIVDQDFFDRDYLKKSVLELIPDLKY